MTRIAPHAIDWELLAAVNAIFSVNRSGLVPDPMCPRGCAYRIPERNLILMHPADAVLVRCWMEPWSYARYTSAVGRVNVARRLGLKTPTFEELERGTAGVP